MKKVALLTPWPPQPSGIADYAFDLAAHLRGICTEVHVFTSEQSPRLLDAVKFHWITKSEQVAEDLEEFDHILVQLGNHPDYHGYMLPFLEQHKHKCTIQLHDLVLHHLLKGVLAFGAAGEQYFSWLEKKYGTAVSDSIRSYFSSDGDPLECRALLDYPCSDILTKGARSVIVHSNFVKQKLERRGVRNVAVVDLCMHVDEIKNSSDRKSQCLQIGVFGGVQKNRRVDWIIEALATLRCPEIPPWQLEIVGDVDDDCKYLLEVVKTKNLSDRVFFRGRLHLGDFNEKLADCDLLVALRSPTMGETSGVVTRALSLGVPTIVSDVGWYSELPDCVIKVNDDNAIDSLSKCVHWILTDQTALPELKDQTLQFARDRLNISTTADDILRVLLEPTIFKRAISSKPTRLDGHATSILAAGRQRS
jgi:glycosyltransferase involved in cell wall biosynthesis